MRAGRLTRISVNERERMEGTTRSSNVEPEPVVFEAEDGFAIKGFVWRRRAAGDAYGQGGGRASRRPVVIINAATSVRCRYYFRFAGYLAEHGFDVMLYDYRGIGESRPARLAGFSATWLDWGRLDFEAVLRFAQRAFAGQPIDVVAHSIGGFVLGLAPSNAAIRRVFTMGAQYAYWRDYAAQARLAMLLKWHLAMPALAALFGYVPAARLGWMEDTPYGVALSWSRSRARFEDTYRRAPLALAEDKCTRLVQQFAHVRAPLLAVSVTDDPFGTVPAIERLLGYFSGSAARTHLRIAPADAGADAIGHFAFFHPRFETTLWPIALRWLETGTIASDLADRIVTRHRTACCTRRQDSPLSDLSGEGSLRTASAKRASAASEPLTLTYSSRPILPSSNTAMPDSLANSMRSICRCP
jgi:predicted alpha/beta hydrolase